MEYPPARHFIVIIVFLGIFSILITTMPVLLLAEEQDFLEFDVPDHFKAVDLSSYADVDSYTFPGYGVRHHEKIGGHDIMLYHSTISDFIRIRHVYILWGLFFYGEHSMEWYNDESPSVNRGPTLSYEEMDLDYDASVNMSVYMIKCKHFWMDTYLCWNESLGHTKPSEALVAGDLDIVWGITLEQMGTGLNAYDMIAMLLLFQCPNVHPTVNFIIALPIWVCIGWLMFAFIIAIVKSLPFT